VTCGQCPRQVDPATGWSLTYPVDHEVIVYCSPLCVLDALRAEYADKMSSDLLARRAGEAAAEAAFRPVGTARGCPETACDLEAGHRGAHLYHPAPAPIPSDGRSNVVRVYPTRTELETLTTEVDQVREHLVEHDPSCWCRR